MAHVTPALRNVNDMQQTVQPFASWTKQELQARLDRFARKRRYKAKRSMAYVDKMNESIDELNDVPSSTLAELVAHPFYTVVRDLLRDLLLEWHSSLALNRDETYLLRTIVRLLGRLVKSATDVSLLGSWLADTSLIKALATCLSDIDRLLEKGNDENKFKSLTRLFDAFILYYRRLPSIAPDDPELNRLVESTMDCLVSSTYDRTFRKLKPEAASTTVAQRFFLIQCPSFLVSQQGQTCRLSQESSLLLSLTLIAPPSPKVRELLLSTMIPRYASILDKHIQSIQQWHSTMIHIVHHLLLTVIHVKDFYTPYANGQPLQWFIDHLIRLVSSSSAIDKINERASTPETLLIDTVLRTLNAFVHEPDLLAYIKHLKIVPVLRSLIFLPYESIACHAYVILSYTLDEHDIKASEKDAGRLLCNIFDSLRKNFHSSSRTNEHEQAKERNISLLIEAIQGRNADLFVSFRFAPASLQFSFNTIRSRAKS